MSSHVVRIVTAFVTAVRCVVNTRGMRCVDEVVRKFVDQFTMLQAFLDDKRFDYACSIFARYLTADGNVPSTMALLADAMEPVLLLSIPDVPRHRGADYDCLFVAMCSEDTAQLARRTTIFSDDLLERCAFVRRSRKQRTPVNGRILFVHANEKNYDRVPQVAKATSLSNKRLTDTLSMEFFYAAEMQFDRMRHVEVPRHIPLDMLVDWEKKSAAVRAELHRDSLAGWRIALRDPSKLPVLRTDDIIVRLLGVRAGQIVRVESRDAALGGTTFEYHQIM